MLKMILFLIGNKINAKLKVFAWIHQNRGLERWRFFEDSRHWGCSREGKGKNRNVVYS